MNRKPWMPQTLTGWVGFLTTAIAFLTVVGAGLYRVGNGLSGLKGLRADVEVVSANVDTLTTEVAGIRVDVDGLAQVLKDFTVEMRCVVDKFVEGETLGYRDCVPVEANGGES